MKKKSYLIFDSVKSMSNIINPRLGRDSKAFCFGGLNFLEFLDKILPFLGGEPLIFIMVVVH